MIYTWNNKDVKILYEFDASYKHSKYGCDGGYTSLSVLINRCQNFIKLKYTNDNQIPPEIPVPITPWSFVLDDVEIIVYMTLRCYDLFVSTLNGWDYREHFTVKIDDDMGDDIVIVSSADKKYVEAVRIIGR